MNTSSAPIYLHYRLQLRSPAIVSTLSRDPNSSVTLPFIPGSTLRGVVAARLIGQGVTGDEETFRRLVHSGAVRYLHAYPDLDGERSLPVPASWRRAKVDATRAIDLAAFPGRIDASTDPEDFQEVWPDEDLIAVRAPFAAASPSAGARGIAAPAISSRVHQQRDRIKGRPWKDRADQAHGTLFVCEYLEPGQVFRGVIQFLPEAVDDIERIERLLGAAPILVGRSRRAGYGGEAVLEFTGQAPRECENASGQISGEVAAGASFRALLASAAIVRHRTTGQVDPAALGEELCRRLGDIATVERTCWTFEAVGGFNRKWRLELSQAHAVAGGSVLVLKAKDAIPAGTLRAIEHEGIGERRVEGFGRVLFLEHSDDQRRLRLHRDDEQVQAPEDDGALSEPDRHQLKFLECRLVLAAVRAELDRVAALDLASKAQGKLPTNSLLGRLRTLFRRVTDEATAREALEELRTWCGDHGPQALKENARKKLDGCHINEKSLRQWLQQLAESDHGKVGWDALVRASGSQTTLTGLASKSFLLQQSSAQEILNEHSAMLRVHLIDSVLVAMARKNRGRAQ